jgi:CDP-diacylglycerol pyrophosphatase
MGSAKIVTALGAMGLFVLTASPSAASLPRDTLWRVEQACLLNHQTTGSPFPCLEVDLAGGIEHGFAVLQAPFEQKHIVLMPTSRIIGVEATKLRNPGTPNYFQAAWNARHFVQESIKRPLAWGDIGLAVNSRLTRSQDQLHIHIECVRQDVKLALARLLPQVPTASWKSSAFVYEGQSYWARRVENPSLDGVNVFKLADELPAFRRHSVRTILAVIGVVGERDRNGFLILAGQSAPTWSTRRSTSEDLLDPLCGSFK